jgi:lipoprotein-releasing system ATP-binding protein
MNELIIDCQSVNCSYREANIATPVLTQLNLQVRQGETLAILGRSGCGKSTLMNLLGGINKPDQGKIFINQIDITRLNEAKSTQLRAKNLGFIYQFHHLLKDFTALKNTMLPLLIQGASQSKAEEEARTLLNKVHLEHRLHHLPNELSGGERQRVAVVRSLIAKPKCLLADEPTGNLDTHNAAEVLEIMLALNNQQQSALILVTHDQKIADKMQRVLVLENGQLNGT